MPKRNLYPCLAALTLVLAAGGNPAHAQQAGAWPSKPVLMVLRGGDELESRMYAEKLAAVFGKPFIIEQKPGAGGNIASAYVAKAPADGYTLLCTNSSFVTAPAFNDKLPFDAIKDFAPVSWMSTAPQLLMAHPGLPANNMREYIAYARANPGKIVWGTSGAGGIQHLSGAWLHDLIGAEVSFIHYKNGTLATQDMVAGRVHVQPRSLSGPYEFVKAGKLKVIGSLSAKRDPMMPDVATAQEAGLKDFDQPSFVGYSATGGTDRAIVNRLSAEFAKIARLPDIRQKLEPLGNILVGSTPEEFAQLLTTQINTLKKLVKEKNIREE